MENTAYNDMRRRQREEGRLRNSLPTRYVMILTNKCNLSCDFCFQDRKALPKQMTFEDWVSVLPKLPAGSHLTLTGGEPLSFRKFDDFFRIAAQSFTLNVISNGVLLEDRHLDLFLSTPNMKVLSISIDTIGNTNRKVPPAKYAAMVERLAKLRARRAGSANPNLLIDAKTVVTEESIPDLFAIFRHVVEDVGVDTHAFQFLKGSPLQHCDKMFDFREIYKSGEPYIYQNVEGLAEQFDKVRAYCIENKRNSYTHPSWFNFRDPAQNYLDVIKAEINRSELEPRRYRACGSPWESAHINADGLLFPCLSVSLGDVRSVGSFDQLYYEGVGADFRRTIFEAGTVPACNRCGYLELSK